MNADGWKRLVQKAVDEDLRCNPEKLNLLARRLEMVDEAKQELRNRGYGWIGINILETCQLVPYRTFTDMNGIFQKTCEHGYGVFEICPHEGCIRHRP